ncbi:MAG: cell division ATP-binding protein FtsE [Deltaproteobacteria bacterium]|nr:cell division ATP-binding protein FtsE [Deltaproteobacteria bacterium]
MIQLFHVSKTYPPRSQALIDINLTIEQGEFVFLTGPSGAGKTTLMKLLFREEEPSDGQILVDGKNINRFNRHGIARLRRNIGLVFQEFKLLPRLSVIDNVSLAAEAIGKPRRDSQTKAYQLLRDLGLREKYEAKPMTLSGGEQQRVAIARALINDPALVLADEPTGNLDAERAEETMKMFLKIRERGTTIFVASHDIGLIRRFGTRIISLRSGVLVDDLQRVEPIEPIEKKAGVARA